MTAGTPARRYSWAPFVADNEAAATHGAKSPRKVSPIAEQIMAEIVEVAPWAAQPAFGPSLAALSWTEAQLVLVRRYVDEHGPLAEDGTPLPALSTLNELERRAARQRAEFGLSPTTWAALRRAVVGDPDGGTSGAAAVRAVGRQLLELASGASDGRQPTTDNPIGVGEHELEQLPADGRMELVEDRDREACDEQDPTKGEQGVTTVHRLHPRGGPDV